MTSQFKNMLYLFGANANGAAVKIDGQLNIDKIRKYSIEQGIWTLVYPELAKIRDVSKYQPEFFALVSQAIARKEFTLNIIKKLEAAGIKCCLLKGAAISLLYADSECRISSDTDILIASENEEKVSKLLLEYGYQVEKRDKNDHHLKAYHKIGGLLEVHIMLYSHTTAEILFNGLDMYSESWDKIDIAGYEYHILGINDGLMYLTAHYVKHLVNEGGGVRQMMDLLLYMEKYKDRIDFERYNSILKELKYDKLIEVVKSIGDKYFGFDYEVKDAKLMEKILTDSEIGGIFGAATDGRQNFYDTYCEKRTTMSSYKYKIFKSLKSENSIFDKLFPKQGRLINVYGYTYAKNKALVPIGWLHRYYDILFRKRKKTVVHENNEFSERMKLMQDLGMIE